MKVLVLGRIKAGVFFKPGRPQLTLFLFVLQEGVGENKRQLAACLYCLGLCPHAQIVCHEGLIVTVGMGKD